MIFFIALDWVATVIGYHTCTKTVCRKGGEGGKEVCVCEEFDKARSWGRDGIRTYLNVSCKPVALGIRVLYRKQNWIGSWDQPRPQVAEVTWYATYKCSSPFLYGTTEPSGTALISRGSLPPCVFKMYCHPASMRGHRCVHGSTPLHTQHLAHATRNTTVYYNGTAADGGDSSSTLCLVAAARDALLILHRCHELL